MRLIFFSGILYVAIFIPVFIYAYQEALDVWENLFVVLIVSFVAWLVAAIPCAFAFAFFRGILEIIADIVYAIWVKIKY